MTSYTYVSCDCSDGRLYIGSHRGNTDDSYLGSSSDESFKPKHKLILSEHDSRIVANFVEARLQKAWLVRHNPRFANRQYDGLRHSEEANAKMREALSKTKKGKKLTSKQAESQCSFWTTLFFPCQYANAKLG